MSPQSPRTLLWVDDEPNLLKSYRRTLRTEPYTVLTAQSGAEALALIQQQKVQVVISDYRMPQMNGIELLAEIKRIDPRIVRVILSGYADEASIEAALRNGGIWRYLLKPIDNPDLLAQVREMFSHYGNGAPD